MGNRTSKEVKTSTAYRDERGGKKAFFQVTGFLQLKATVMVAVSFKGLK